MCVRTQKRCLPCFYLMDRRSHLGIIVAMFSFLTIISGCVSSSSKELYENPEFGITLVKPGNWRLEFYERSGLIALERESGFRDKESARIEIDGFACPATLDYDHVRAIEDNIDRLGILYDLDSIEVVHEPRFVDAHDYRIVTTTIKIPTESLPENSSRNQVRQNGPNTFQLVDMHAVSDDSDNSIMVYIYRGNSDEINAEAEDIVGSIRIICPVEP